MATTLGSTFLPKLTELAQNTSKNSNLVNILAKGWMIMMDVLKGVAIGVGSVVKLLAGAKAVGITLFESLKIMFAGIKYAILNTVKSAVDVVSNFFNWIFGILEKGGKILFGVDMESVYHLNYLKKGFIVSRHEWENNLFPILKEAGKRLAQINREEKWSGDIVVKI